MKAILERVSAQSPLKAVRAADWLDCGNADRQAASHQALLQKRAFNELKIDPVLGTITKKSRNVEKFIDEINYLRLLPPSLAVLFPRVVDFSVAWESPHLTLEYYGYPTLAEAYVFENVDPGCGSGSSPTSARSSPTTSWPTGARSPPGCWRRC